MRLVPLLLLAVMAHLSSACKTREQAIRGKVHLSADLQKTLRPTAALYIIARRPGEVSGPPLAVKKIAPPLLFPVDYALLPPDLQDLQDPQNRKGPAGSFEGNLSISARVSQSGSATPIAAGDIEGFALARAVPVGARDVDIQLDQVRRDSGERK